MQSPCANPCANPCRIRARTRAGIRARIRAGIRARICVGLQGTPLQIPWLVCALPCVFSLMHVCQVMLLLGMACLTDPQHRHGLHSLGHPQATHAHGHDLGHGYECGLHPFRALVPAGSCRLPDPLRTRNVDGSPRGFLFHWCINSLNP